MLGQFAVLVDIALSTVSAGQDSARVPREQRFRELLRTSKYSEPRSIFIANQKLPGPSGGDSRPVYCRDEILSSETRIRATAQIRVSFLLDKSNRVFDSIDENILDS